MIQTAYARAWADPATAPTWYASRLPVERAMAPLVRAHLPLSVVLGARAGDALPPDRGPVVPSRAT